MKVLPWLIVSASGPTLIEIDIVAPHLLAGTKPLATSEPAWYHTKPWHRRRAEKEDRDARIRTILAYPHPHAGHWAGGLQRNPHRTAGRRTASRPASGAHTPGASHSDRHTSPANRRNYSNDVA